MKKWIQPDMKVMDMKVNENIAASGGDQSKYDTIKLLYNSGGITRGGANYRCKGTAVQDTSVNYYKVGPDNVIDDDKVPAVAGCLA